MQTDLQILNNNQKMSSKEISELTGKNHSDVMRDIKVMAEALEIDVSKIAGIYLDAYNREQPCYNLDKEQTLCLVSGYNAKLRMAIIKRWQELEAQQKPKQLSRKEMALMVIAQEEEIERLQIELDQSKMWLTIKKVAHHNNVNWQQLEWRKLKEASLVLGYIPKKIFDANFPNGVNVYHKDAWKMIYPNFILPNGDI